MVQQSLGTGLKDRRERVSEYPLAVRELSHIVCISQVRLAGGLAPVRVRGLRACLLTGGLTQEVRTSHWVMMTSSCEHREAQSPWG